MDSIICPLGIFLLFGILIAIIVFLYRKDQRTFTGGIPDERRIFYIFLIATIATGFVIAIGIVFKSDVVFIAGFLIFGVVAAIRGIRYLARIAKQDSTIDSLE
ncbi:MAG: hypothetical protein ACXABY_34345 [Candidatus Thorarchaeota archaeon]|jgi:hypothetical protein